MIEGRRISKRFTFVLLAQFTENRHELSFHLKIAKNKRSSLARITHTHTFSLPFFLHDSFHDWIRRSVLLSLSLCRGCYRMASFHCQLNLTRKKENTKLVRDPFSIIRCTCEINKAPVTCNRKKISSEEHEREIFVVCRIIPIKLEE